MLVSSSELQQLLQLLFQLLQPAPPTHPARPRQVLNPDQVPLQLRQLLEVLQPDQAALELRSDLRHLLQSLCGQRKQQPRALEQNESAPDSDQVTCRPEFFIYFFFKYGGISELQVSVKITIEHQGNTSHEIRILAQKNSVSPHVTLVSTHVICKYNGNALNPAKWAVLETFFSTYGHFIPDLQQLQLCSV